MHRLLKEVYNYQKMIADILQATHHNSTLLTA